MTLSLLLVVRPASGGIRQHIITLVRRLGERGITVAIAAPGSLLTTLPKDIAELALFPIEIAGSYNPARDVVAAYQLTRVISGGYDIIHSHGLRAGLVTSLSLSGRHVPHVVTFHNLLSRGFATTSALKLIASCSQAFIAVSPNIASELKSMAPNVARVVIPNGIRISDFEKKSGAMDSVFAMDKTKPIVGCVARLSKEKGVDVFLEAARMLPDTACMIAGDGPDREMLQNLAPDNVEFLGRVANIPDVYRAFDVVVIPSRSEGQGIVALEAMAAGVPIVASEVGGLAAMLTHRRTAMLVPVGSSSMIAQAVGALLEYPNLSNLLIENGRNLVREHYGDEQMTSSTMDLYDTILRPA